MTYIGSNQRLDRYRKVYCLDKHPFQARSFRDEQLAVYIRYAVDLDVRERFLSFADCSNCRETLKQRVGKCLERSANSSSVLRWCSCHGWKGQKEVRSLHPNVVYIHCIVHRLKLVIVASCLSTRHAVSFFSNIEGAFHWAFSGGSLAMHESPADRRLVAQMRSIGNGSPVGGRVAQCNVPPVTLRLLLATGKQQSNFLIQVANVCILELWLD